MPDLLGQILDPAARRRGLAEARLLTDWTKVIGAEIASRCQPVRLARDGSLHLHVSGSAALEIQHNELQLVDRINTFFGRPAVTRLRLLQTPPRRRSLPPAPPPPARALSPGERDRIERMVEPVADADLRLALAALGGTLRRRRND